MSVIKLVHPTRKIKTEVVLPGSKSESNRALILNALTGNQLKITNLSTARDTQNLLAILSSQSNIADVQDAGTAMRFLTAYYAAINKQQLITGSARMQQRPIGPLVNALSELGFDVRYTGQEGYPPVAIYPVSLEKLEAETYVEGHISSQFITALLLIAPFLDKGLAIRFTSELTSKPYVEMTLEMLKHFGVDFTWKDNVITVQPAHIEYGSYHVGADWSSASYWYAIAFLADEAEVFLKGLRNDWSQGDRVVADWMKRFGVFTEFNDEGALLKKVPVNYPAIMKLNFRDNPDLAQTFAALFAAKNIIATFTGLESLKIKETDRVAALRTELMKAGIKFEYAPMYEFYQLKGDFTMPAQPIQTYNDHRMAMSFAAWAMLGQVSIQDPAVVEKSYPSFWEDLKHAGFILQ